VTHRYINTGGGGSASGSGMGAGWFNGNCRDTRTRGFTGGGTSLGYRHPGSSPRNYPDFSVIRPGSYPEDNVGERSGHRNRRSSCSTCSSTSRRTSNWAEEMYRKARSRRAIAVVRMNHARGINDPLIEAVEKFAVVVPSIMFGGASGAMLLSSASGSSVAILSGHSAEGIAINTYGGALIGSRALLVGSSVPAHMVIGAESALLSGALTRTFDGIDTELSDILFDLGFGAAAGGLR